MTNPIPRRHFLGAAAALAAGSSARSAETGPNDRIVVGVMGTGSRGSDHIRSFSAMPGVEVAWVCDPDDSRSAKAATLVPGKSPKPVRDFRRILDDKAVDVLVVATCNHWHAPAAILACKAGKHVYVEKPCSHTPDEGERLVKAARDDKRVVQMGNQRRSWPKIIEAIEAVRKGDIGRAYFARCLYSDARPSIGKGHETTPPSNLDFDLWQGPAPRRPYRDNMLHYNWHWFWHWGNGELGNNGVHMIDLARWGLGADFPLSATSTGGRFRYEDDQETPDTHVVSFEFPDKKAITWEGLSCNAYRPGGPGEDVVFFGTEGSISLTRGGYTVHDVKGKLTKTVEGEGGDAIHIKNFLDAVKGEAKPNSEIAEGHRSTLLCHLGNIAHRTGRTLKCDPSNGHIVNDPEAEKLWAREYEKGWEF